MNMSVEPVRLRNKFYIQIGKTSRILKRMSIQYYNFNGLKSSKRFYFYRLMIKCCDNINIKQLDNSVKNKLKKSESKTRKNVCWFKTHSKFIKKKTST